jgi:hypothetical protein
MMFLLSLAAHLVVVLGLATTSSSSTTKIENNDDKGDAAVHRYLKPFSLELHDFPQTGRGVRTLVDRSPGEILIQIPVQDTITVSSASSSSSSISTSSRSLRLLEEKKKDAISEEQLLALALVLLRKDDHPYVSTVLPHDHLGVWTLPASLFKSLCLPRCYREFFQATRNTVLDFMSMDDDTMLEGENAIIESSAELKWGFSMVRSRSLAVPELPDDELALIPGLDMFNHVFHAGTSLQLVDDAWTLVSSKSYSAGDQIYLSYGDEKDNWKLLQTYGFSANNNPNAFVFWTWEDLLDAASQLRPNMFTERVCQSLLFHPQLKAYSALTETRAIFSFDAKQGVPRESLQTGLTLMMSLASQLGFPDDEDLPGEVMNRLIENRLKELDESRKGQSKMEKVVPAEWKPFWDSTLRNLQDEEAYLKAATTEEGKSSEL